MAHAAAGILVYSRGWGAALNPGVVWGALMALGLSSQTVCARLSWEIAARWRCGGRRVAARSHPVSLSVDRGGGALRGPAPGTGDQQALLCQVWRVRQFCQNNLLAAAVPEYSFLWCALGFPCVSPGYAHRGTAPAELLAVSATSRPGRAPPVSIHLGSPNKHAQAGSLQTASAFSYVLLSQCARGQVPRAAA